MNEAPCRVALTGPVALELVSAAFRAAGYAVHDPSVETLEAFHPDFVYDVTAHERVLAAEVEGFHDARFGALAGAPYSRAGLAALVEEFAWERLRSPRKVLAVDADNTLWKGILSEDGPAALVPYAEFQEGLRELARDGVILVLLSKNDPFSLDWFADCRVNWDPKPGNLIEACRALGVTTDSVVFVDDSPHERALMSAHLPEVAVAPFPADLTRPRQFLRRLREYFFADVGRTDEDRLRAADYAHRRLLPPTACASRADYLKDLRLTVRPRRAEARDLDRLAQMAGKTNQFNATTIRRTRDEFAALLAADEFAVWVFETADRFGPQGIVSYVVADRRAARLTDFVMSCRALGRTLEQFVYAYVTRQLGVAPAIDCVPTAKNGPFRRFLASRTTDAETHYREVKDVA